VLTRIQRQLYALRQRPETRAEAAQVNAKHGSRKSGLPQAKPQRRRPREPAQTPIDASEQGELF
jgi:deoxyribodipyrimidine photo-lyase